MRLSDTIESFIKTMLESEETPGVELKRNELAEYFGCAPSQINYVLSTRFTPDHGYMIESHRGGGGYIRIVRLVEAPAVQILRICGERIGDAIGENEAVRLIAGLVHQGTISEQDGLLMRAAVSGQALGVPLPEAIKDALRARLMKSMLMATLQRKA